MKPIIFYILTFFLITACVEQQVPNEKNTVEAELTELLQWFLDGASYSDYNVHQQFWADELIYTGSGGTRTTKADIIAGMVPGSRIENPTTFYSGDQIQIQVFGDIAVVAFRLIGTNTSDDSQQFFYNTGTFKWIGESWRAVAWQATRIPD